MIRFRTALFTAASAALLALPANAADDRTAPAGDSTLASPALDYDAAIRHANAAGIRQIEDIEFDDGRWEVEGRDARGRELEVKLHPDTGKIIAREPDDDSWWNGGWWNGR